CMRLRMFKIMTPVQRIKPRIKKESGPFGPLDDETTRCQALRILSDDQVHIFFLQVAKGLNDAIRWHDWNVLQHERFQALLLENMRFEREGGVHDQGVLREVEEVRGRWMLG